MKCEFCDTRCEMDITYSVYNLDNNFYQSFMDWDSANETLLEQREIYPNEEFRIREEYSCNDCGYMDSKNLE